MSMEKIIIVFFKIRDLIEEIMCKDRFTVDPFHEFLTRDIEGVESLIELALDMRWSWNHHGDEVWRHVDPELWELTHNPWLVLLTVPHSRLRDVMGDSEFCENVNELLSGKQKALERIPWFQQYHQPESLSFVAYFSMEFMLSEALPIYSGGLGNVAGDQLKSAGDLGVPVIGVSLLFQQGYVRQVIDKDGAQQAIFPYNDPQQLPITPVRDPEGEWLRVSVELPGATVRLRTWQVQVGRTKLYLLDSNDAANLPIHRGITSELYGGSRELRLQQEMILGVGGWRLLEALDIHPDVCHLNEGHAAFAILERTRSFMEASGLSFKVALTSTRAGNIFTTHTAVPAGFDCFAPDLIERYLNVYVRNYPEIPVREILSMGRWNPADLTEDFNMALLAIRGSGAVNGVSQLHGKVSRKVFQSLFPSWPQEEVPIGYVTNGVHMSTWDSEEADDLWTESCGKDRWLGTTEYMELNIRQIPDEQLWKLRIDASKSLIDYARKRLVQQLAASGEDPETIETVRQIFSHNVLTLGFARRFATYKRPNLLLHDPQRLIRLLTNPQRPVQLIIAGKAHPADKAGQEMIQEWIRFIRRPEVRSHAMFLADHDMYLTEQLVKGVDVWINMPRRPWEACGTSGMKVLVNGGLNLSELDGWWAEAYSPEVGWALGDGQEHGNDPEWDAIEAKGLYNLLENEIIPEFYNRGEDGIPSAWVERMRESMARLTPRFSANRAVREYTAKYYLPAAAAFRERIENNCEAAIKMASCIQYFEQKWPRIRFGEMKVETIGGQHVFNVQVNLNDFNCKDVCVELYAEGVGSYAPMRQEMKHSQPIEGKPGIFVYSAFVPAIRPAADYTARLIPHIYGLSVPLEAPYIVWQR